MLVIGSYVRYALYAILVFGSTVDASARQSPPLPPPSQPWVDDTIETALNACLTNPAQSRTTIAIDECYGTAEKHYEAAMGAAYETALKHVDSVTAARLRESQKSWVAFRKDVRAVNGAPWVYDNRGTIIGSLIAQSDDISLKARILQIDLIWPGFALGDEPLEIRTENEK